MAVKLSDLCAMAPHYGAAAAEPHPRDSAPTAPFRVIKTDIQPNARVGTIYREHDPKMRGSDLVPNDMIMHLMTGVVCRVVERLTPWDCRVEAWVPPQGEHELAKWDAEKGLGVWVCWGQCYMDPQKLPHRLRQPEEIMPGPEFRDALWDVHPGLKDKKTWAERVEEHGGKVPRNFADLPRGARRRIVKQWQKMLGAAATARDWTEAGAAEAELDKHTFFQTERHAGEEKLKFSKIHLPTEPDDE